MRRLTVALFVMLFPLSAYAGNLIVEGPTERGDGRLPVGPGTFTVDVYGENLPNVGIVQISLVFQKSGASLPGFQISLTGGNPDFAGQAIFVNTDLFPDIVPIFDTDRQLAGLVAFVPVNITQKMRIFTIVYDYPADAAGVYSVETLAATTQVTDLGSNDIPFTSVPGSAAIGQITYLVDDDAPADFSTIQAAINAAGTGDTIIVKDGTYTGDGNRDLDFGGKGIALCSQNGAAATTIDCQGTAGAPHRAFNFCTGETAAASVAGFTIVNGRADYGGAIRCDGASPAISMCIIRANAADQSGGAISCANAAAPSIKGCALVHNTAVASGGAIACDGASITVQTSTIADNAGGQFGGGIYCVGASATISNSIVYGNTATEGAQIALARRLTPEPPAASQLAAGYSDIAGGQAAAYVETDCTLTWGTGNIDALPQFFNAANNDYRLVTGSACINAGDPAYAALPGETDLAGLARVQNGRIDIGAYENVPVRTWYVAVPYDPLENGSAAHPYNQIQKAIDAAANGEVVIVKNGTYIGTGNRDVDFKGKAITVRSENGATNCIVDVQKTTGKRGFYFHTNETASAVLDGIKIINGNAVGAADPKGGAIFCSGASPTIQNCTISNCTADSGGAIALISGSKAAVTNNIIEHNTATHVTAESYQPEVLGGGGMLCSDSSPSISGNTIRDNQAAGANGGGIMCTRSAAQIGNNQITTNTAKWLGGGIHCYGKPSPTISGNTITGNQSGYNDSGVGGGIDCWESALSITNNTISSNKAGCGAGVYAQASDGTVAGNTFVGNTATAPYRSGGGLYLDRGNGLTSITGNTFSGNTAPRAGGVEVYQADVRIANNVFVQNQATGYFGGGLEVENCSSMEVTGNTFSNNTAGYTGGGVSLWLASGTLSDNTFTGNQTKWANMVYAPLWEGGGGVAAESSMGPSITNNTITGNYSAGDGGGIHLFVSGGGASPSPMISGNIVSGNTSAAGGGGISCYGYDQSKSGNNARVRGNTITGNKAVAAGGGVFCAKYFTGDITGNVISDNIASGNGGGVFITESDCPLNQNTIAFNTGTIGGGVYVAAGTAASPKASLKNCILWANIAPSGAQLADLGIAALTVSYSDLQGGRNAVYLSPSNLAITYASNIDADPLFADAANRDFHLKSRMGRWDPAANSGAGGWVNDCVCSPCIDAGDPASVFSAETTPNGGRINMGAYGNTAEASKTCWDVADANTDCAVNILDLIYIRARLNGDPSGTADCRADTNADGKVNILDLIAVRSRLGAKCP